jgi:hypothetical protein
MAKALAGRFAQAPAQIRALPRDARGYPIPAFVGTLNGQRDFRVIHRDTVAHCVRERLCWICGRGLGRLLAFVIGPMCGVNRISSEPPSHVDCARFAAQNCPFLTTPAAQRDTRGLDAAASLTPGIALARNPGVTLVWICKRFTQTRDGLFALGPPHAVQWYAHGRTATRAEILASIDTGLPALQTLAAAQGDDALAQLHAMLGACLALVPAA